MSSSRFIDLHTVAHQVMGEYNFSHPFPPKVLKETKKIIKTVKLSGDNRIEDMTSLLWSSIDNHDSKDLDQLEYCERKPNREIHVRVAIADVDLYVHKGTLTDKHALHNGTSVYTGIEIFPMIPEILCTHASSLIEGEDRLAIIINFFVRIDGSIRTGNIYRALVRNKAKLVYESLGEWLEGHGPMPEKVGNIDGLKEQLQLQDEAAQRLHTFRMKNGALELDTIEASTVIEEKKVVGLVVKKKNKARYIIENFMIAANRTMVAFLEKHQFFYIQRILRTPERWPMIVEIAHSLKEQLPDEPDSQALSDFLMHQWHRDPDHFPDLSLRIVKLLGSAEYVLATPGRAGKGHFGLAVHDYTHSTAPNRRYVDIIIQRLIKAALLGKNTPYSKDELRKIASWCTLRDKASKKVERFVRKVAGAILIRNRIGEIFDAIVTGASEKGTYVRLLQPPVEGKVVYQDRGMDVGQQVRVRLIRVEPHKGFIDFEGIKTKNEFWSR